MNSDATKGDSNTTLFLQFFELVRLNPKKFPDRNDLEGWYEFLDVVPKTADVLSSSEILENLGRIVVELLAGKDFEVGAINSIRKQLVAKYILENIDMDAPIAVVEFIQNAVIYKQTSQVVKSLVETEAWMSAIQFAYISLTFKDSAQLSGWIELEERRGSFAAPRAVKALRNLGYGLSIWDGETEIEDGESERLIADLEIHIRNVGGLRVVQKVFQQLEQKWNPTLARYQVAPPMSELKKAPEPQVPYSMLLNLAIKVGMSEPFMPAQRSTKLLKRLFATARSYAALSGLQHYHVFQWAYTPDALNTWAKSVVGYDQIFGVKHMRLDDCKFFLRKLLCWLDEPSAAAWTASNKITFDELEKFVLQILAEVGHHRGPKRFQKKDVERWREKFGTEKIDKLLSIFAHHSGKANQSYVALLSGKSDFSKKPLILNSDGSIDLISSHFCAPNFLIAVAISAIKTLNAIDKEFVTRKIGDAIEALTAETLIKNGFRVLSGEYVEAGEKGQCDIAFETPSFVFLVECKAKSLTNAALEGDEAMLLLDLCLSLVHAQRQAQRTARILRRDGIIILKDKLGVETELHLNGREIICIALTHDEYGRLHDKTLAAKLLGFVATHSFEPTDPNQTEKFEEMKKFQTEVSLSNPTSLRDFFYYSHFMSMAQLLALLRLSQNPATFEELFEKVQNLITGSGDFYDDLTYTLMLDGTIPTKNGKLPGTPMFSMAPRRA
jgi:hypothetical protein